MSSIRCQMQQGIDGAEFSVGHIFVFAGEKTPDNWPCQCGQELYNSKDEQLKQAQDRVAELEKLQVEVFLGHSTLTPESFHKAIGEFIDKYWREYEKAYPHLTDKE